MRRIIAIALLLLTVLCGCSKAEQSQNTVCATTAPVAQLAKHITEGTGVEVVQIITDSVSCLHDYSLSVRQMEQIEKSDLLLINGAGLEDFLADVPAASGAVDCSAGVELTQGDPHIWLDPDNAAEMAQNICNALSETYPAQAQAFQNNLNTLTGRLAELKQQGVQMLSGLKSRKLITFHDGFSYFAEAFDLEVLASIEEEHGSEASAADLHRVIGLVEEYGLAAVFTEVNGSDAAASVICSETGAAAYPLDTAMGGSDYFEAMKQNFKTLSEALS